ncbi:tyrosine-protein phosphatase non-receptor type 1 isoform X2 [Ambystoma mexicanum]|uniref:tyrosine-protein phosphatase non-receptor type 1 isoform X2 n=1 Tax=Ambystoma mexicanum TaxID=8296 RepID=UPI0037E825E7
MDMEKDFLEIDRAGKWSAVYQDIRHEASDFPCKFARLPENKNRNRYRDVSPFDHSRIKLHQGENDYINASLITMEEAQRSYILTQIKCAQYWPVKEEKEMVFDDTNLKLTLISEDIKSYYTVRLLKLESLTSHETREILHFHYTTWPDFGVPESPASFLNFLFKVRESGSLNPEHGPIVVHCSAGIGRSGTFCLADTCLLLMAKRKDPSLVDIKKVLLDMRNYRMGLIQTADQLRFSYLAVIEGAKFIMGDSSVQEQWKEQSNEDSDPPPEHSPPPPRPPKRNLETHNGKMHEQSGSLPKQMVVEEIVTCVDSAVQKTLPDDRASITSQLNTESTCQDTDVRRRTVGSNSNASPQRNELLTSENLEEDEESLRSNWKPFIANICLFTVFTAGAYLCYRVCFH